MRSCEYLPVWCPHLGDSRHKRRYSELGGHAPVNRCEPGIARISCFQVQMVLDASHLEVKIVVIDIGNPLVTNRASRRITIARHGLLCGRECSSMMPFTTNEDT